MIDTPDNCVSSCCLCNIMEQCSRQCIRRTFFAVLVGVSPIVICLLFIGLARLILYRLEMVYYRRQKITDRRPSIFSYQSGRLALSYTPVSDAELQRIIQGEYQNQQLRESSAYFYNNYGNSRKAPKFIRSILPRRETMLPGPNILANLVIRRNAIDSIPMTSDLPPIEAPLQPTFSIINEQENRRPSTITIMKEPIATASTITTTVAMINNNTNNNNNNDNNDDGNFSTPDDFIESESMTIDQLFNPVKTLTTVVVEDFLEFHSVSSLPSLSNVLSSITQNNTEKNSEINKT